MTTYIPRARLDLDPVFVDLFDDFYPKYPRTDLKEFKDLLYALEEKRTDMREELSKQVKHPYAPEFASLLSKIIKEARLVCKKAVFKKFLKKYVRQIYYADHDASPLNFYHPLNYLINKKEAKRI